MSPLRLCQSKSCVFPSLQMRLQQIAFTHVMYLSFQSCIFVALFQHPIAFHVYFCCSKEQCCCCDCFRANLACSPPCRCSCNKQHLLIYVIFLFSCFLRFAFLLSIQDISTSHCFSCLFLLQCDLLNIRKYMLWFLILKSSTDYRFNQYKMNYFPLTKLIQQTYCWNNPKGHTKA